MYKAYESTSCDTIPNLKMSFQKFGYDFTTTSDSEMLRFVRKTSGANAIAIL